MLSKLKSELNRRSAVALKTKILQMRNEGPLISFTFDDVTRSSTVAGAEILESVGACGTYYVAGGLCGTEYNGRPFASAEDICRLHERGHEIGCHTFSHQRVPSLSRERVRSEVGRNAGFIRRICGDLVLSNFAYPFGDVSPGHKLLLQSTFASCRGISPGINVDRIDLGLLKAVPLYNDRIDLATVARYLDEAAMRKGWLIFYTHEVDHVKHPYGASINLLEFCVAEAKARGFDIIPVRNALGRVAFRPLDSPDGTR
jgi:peptidoglycan/xylan/chitin deacetylase (PgdA/CDA1 family)